MTATDQPGLFELAELLPKPVRPVLPSAWASFPEGPDRSDHEPGGWTGPCLYASPARGLTARLAEYDLWWGLYGGFGCAVDSHAWRPRSGSMSKSAFEVQLARHEPFLLDCDLRRFGKDQALPLPPCGHGDGETWLHYRSVCRKTGCDWEGPERGRENPAAEDGMDHAWPGWRELPTVDRVPDYGGNRESSNAKRLLTAWAAKVNAVYPPGWLEGGGPIRTTRTGIGTRHVEHATPYGGYDMAVGPRGFPICGDCAAEGIGPQTPWCVKHWTDERDPEGAASARQLGLMPEEAK